MTTTEFDPVTSLLAKYLDVQGRRADVVAGNLANADTPGYRAKSLDFADFLSQAAADALAPAGRGRAGAPFNDSPALVEQESAAAGLDGNTVDAAREAATLAEIGVGHLAGAQLLQSRLRTLRAAIREGR
jgi:flagellar basal-body rod protein FlgB